MITLIARREILERARTRAFKVGTVVQLLIVGGIALAFALSGDSGTKDYDVGTVRAQQAPVLQTAQAQQQRFDVRLTVRLYATEAKLRTAVEDGDVDAGVTASRILVADSPPDRLVGLLQTAAQPGAPRATVEQVGDSGDDGSGLAFVGTLLLYLTIMTLGYALTASIVEEKGSRVVELLLTSVTPRQLLAGKTLGVGLLGLAQFSLIVVVGVAVAKAAGGVDLPSATVGGVGVVLLFYVLGFALYALAFAACAALVSRQEDIQSVTTPVTLTLVAGYLLSISAGNDPGSGLAQVCAFIPPIAPMITPGLVVQGELSTVALVGSVVATAVGAALVLVVAARVYERAILHAGAPLRLADAARLLRGGGDQTGR